MNASQTTIKNLLTPARIQLNRNVKSKKKALEMLAEIFASSSDDLDQDTIHDALNAREKLGSTALEQGAALPHCRVDSCKQPTAALLTLAEGINFGARDGQPVSVIWGLIVPSEANEQHLKILADIAMTLSDKTARRHISDARDSEQLFAALTSTQ